MNSENAIWGSVVVPTCRRPEQLAECLARLAPEVQTVDRPYEVIVTDDGGGSSPTGAEAFPWVRCVRGPRRGPAANRNHGAGHARGQWILFTDDDCLPDPGWLAGFAEAQRNYPGEKVFDGITISPQLKEKGPLYTAPINHGGMLWSCNICLDRILFQEMEGFDAGFPFAHLEDVEFRLRVQDRRLLIRVAENAVVEHPPRPLGNIFKQVKAHESSFYLWAKRRCSLGEAGLDPLFLLGSRVKSLLSIRSAEVRAIFAGRFLVEITLLPWYALGWYWKYRRERTKEI